MRKYSKTIISLIGTVSVCLISSHLMAGNHDSHHDHDHHDHDHHEHDASKGQKAHLHGYAELKLVLDGNNMEITLDSPSANIVGFEHRASTPAQKDAVESARKVLESSKKLFKFKGTWCQLTEKYVDVSALLSAEDLAAEEKDKHAEHHHDHHDHGSDEQIHSDVAATYKYYCKKGMNLRSVSIIMLDRFPAIEQLKVDWIKDGKQGSSDLSIKSKDVNF